MTVDEFRGTQFEGKNQLKFQIRILKLHELRLTLNEKLWLWLNVQRISVRTSFRSILKVNQLVS